MFVQPIAREEREMSEITIYTLARELKMTPSMVSRAFNPNAKISEEKRRIVLEMAGKYNFSPNKLASRLSRDTVRIGVVINSRFSVNTDEMLAGIRAAHEKLKDYKIKYDITILDPEEQGTDACASALERYEACDGVIISGMSDPKYTPLLEKLVSVNKNVVQVQAINRDVNGLFASKHDESVASACAAEFLSKCLGFSKRKNVLLFTGSLKSALHSSARDAFCETAGRLGLNVIETVDMRDSEEYLREILGDVFERRAGEVDGIYITSGISAPLCDYLEKFGINIPLITFDIHADVKRYIERGVITATIYQGVKRQMQTAFDMLVRCIISADPPPSVVYTDVQLVLRSNMHQFT